MRTMERLNRLREWIYETVCEGRQMKTPAHDGDVRKVKWQEPKVFLANPPTRADVTDIGAFIDPMNTAPGIVLIPSGCVWKNPIERSNDRTNNVHRPLEMGQSLSALVMFFVYEDGVRLPGFIQEAQAGGPYDMTRLTEGTEEGVGTLLNWMDDLRDALLGVKMIPGTDMFLDEASATDGLYADQRFIADRRPVYIGMASVTFQCHADERNDEIRQLLR